MAKNLAPKCKQCRRAGEKLFLKGDRCVGPKCAFSRRGAPVAAKGKKMSEYGTQLKAKQKAKKEYGMMEKQFKLTFEKAQKQTGKAGENLLKLLETRLDNTVFRLGLAESRPKARQIVGHGHVQINGKKVNIPSYQVKAGEVITIKPGSKKSKLFANLEDKVKKAQVPGWLNFDVKAGTAKVLNRPSTEDIKSDIDTQVIVEYYSK